MKIRKTKTSELEEGCKLTIYLKDDENLGEVENIGENKFAFSSKSKGPIVTLFFHNDSIEKLLSLSEEKQKRVIKELIERKVSTRTPSENYKKIDELLGELILEEI